MFYSPTKPWTTFRISYLLNVKKIRGKKFDAISHYTGHIFDNFHPISSFHPFDHPLSWDWSSWRCSLSVGRDWAQKLSTIFKKLTNGWETQHVTNNWLQHICIVERRNPEAFGFRTLDIPPILKQFSFWTLCNGDTFVWFSDVKICPILGQKAKTFWLFRVINFLFKTTQLFHVRKPNENIWFSDENLSLKSEPQKVLFSALYCTVNVWNPN